MVGGPPEEYYTYQDGKWVTTISGVSVYAKNPPYIYTEEELANVTCKITGTLPTDVYPDITVNSFELSYTDGYVTPDYISASYYPVLNTSYGDSQHNPYTNNISFSFDIIFPEKINPEISLNALYKAADTGKLYVPNFTTFEWEEYTGSYLDGTPLMNIIDKAKQDKLNSGENIKTINGASLLGGGDLSLATPAQLNSYLLKNYVRNSRSTSTIGYTYDVRYINNMIKTSRTTSANNTYDCTYINGLIKTSKTTSSANNYTYSCNYMNNTFLTLDTLPRWDGGNQ